MAPQAELWTLVKGAPAGDPIETVRSLIARGADPTWIDPHEGSTAMHLAARSNSEGWVIAWESNGLDLHAKSNSGWTQAMDALRSESVSYFKMLLEVGLDPNDPRERTPNEAVSLLSQAAFAKSPVLIEALLKSKADVHYRGRDQKQAIHDACESVPCLKLLLDAGADVNAREKFGDRLAHRVIEDGLVETFVFLLGRVDVNWKAANDIKMIPLEMAIASDVLGDLMRTHLSATAAHHAIEDMGNARLSFKRLAGARL